MKHSPPFEFPREQAKLYDRAKRWEWITIVYLIIDSVIMYLVLGQSQAMKAAWLDDVFGMIPPVAFLISTEIAEKPANDCYPYGYHRAPLVAFLFAAFALLGLGVYLLVNSVVPLLKAEHTTIASIKIFGETIWFGWLMLLALVFSSGIPPFILGRKKLPIAKGIEDNALHSDARMNRASWLATVAAVIGVIGIGFGYWWADYAAAIIIGISVLMDGIRNTYQVIIKLMDHIPTKLGEFTTDPIIDRVHDYLHNLDWTRDVDLRLRESGHVFFGEAYVVPSFALSASELTKRIDEASQGVLKLDWRMYQFAIIPTMKTGRQD